MYVCIYLSIYMYIHNDFFGAGWGAAALGGGGFFIALHPTPFTPHSTSFTLHLTPYTLHRTPYTVNPGE